MRRLLAVTVVIIALSSFSLGCRSESSPTDLPSGGRALSGQVVPVGDLAGASPSGITVSSNGQVATTSANGAFAFSSLPAKDVQLAFTRSDGISASAPVSASASAIVVQLQKNQATVAVTGQNKREIEGLITAISSSSITVNDASTHGPVTASINSATVIRKGNSMLSATDLKVGDRVHVKAMINSDGSLSAMEIMLQQSGSGDPNSGGQVKELEGLILEVSSSSITVNNASTHGPVTAAITSGTIIRKGNRQLTPGDLKVGDRVHVKTSGDLGSLVAQEIMLQN